VALNKYTLNSTVTLPSGAATASGNGFGTVTYAQAAGEYGSAPGVTFLKGTVIELNPAGVLFTAIGAANLTAFRDGTDAVGHAALAN
jgi:hypothetical protein